MAKRTRGQADLEYELESSGVEGDSSAKDDSSADQNFRPGRARAAKKRRSAGGRAVKSTLRSSATVRTSQRTRKIPRTSTKSATATTAAATTSTSTSTPQAGRGEDLSSAIDPKAHLPQCNLGAVEFLTFFPLHIRWPEPGLRLYRNGWKSLSIAKAMLHARNKIDRHSDRSVQKRLSSMRHQVLSNGRHFFRDEDFTVLTYRNRMTPVTTYDATNYAPREVIPTMFDAKLVDIAQGVVYWPKNDDRGVVTQAIEYAVQDNRQDLTTAHIPHLVAELGLQEPSDASSPLWDQRGRERNEARIELTGNYCTERFSDAYESETESD